MEWTSLRYPVMEDAVILVNYGSRRSAVIRVQLDSTTSNDLLRRLATYFAETPYQGCHAIKSFAFRGISHAQGDATGLRYLTELGLRPDNQINAVLGNSTLAEPPTLPVNQGTLTPERWIDRKHQLQYPSSHSTAPEYHR